MRTPSFLWPRHTVVAEIVNPSAYPDQCDVDVRFEPPLPAAVFDRVVTALRQDPDFHAPRPVNEGYEITALATPDAQAIALRGLHHRCRGDVDAHYDHLRAGAELKLGGLLRQQRIRPDYASSSESRATVQRLMTLE